MSQKPEFNELRELHQQTTHDVPNRVATESFLNWVGKNLDAPKMIALFAKTYEETKVYANITAPFDLGKMRRFHQP